MRLRFYNARILTMEEARPVFTGEVHVEGGRITCVKPVPSEEAQAVSDMSGEDSLSGRREEWDREIDCEGNLLMPGFKNSHTHSPMTFLRSRADDMELSEWLNEVVFPAEACLNDEDVYWCSRLAFLEYLTSGTTAVFDMYFYREPVIKAARDVGYRVVFCGAANDFCESEQEMNRMFERLAGDELLRFQYGFHAEYTTSEPLLRRIAAAARARSAPVYTHCAETKEEVEACRQKTGMTPLAYLDSLGMFENGGGVFHMVHPDESDYAILKERGLYVITNPASNLKLGSGIAPVARMLEMGIPVALGTDGPASNNCLDMFREMFLATGLQKGIRHDARAVDAREVLKMATINGSYAMGIRDTDILAEGNAADMVLINLDRPNMQPLADISKNLVYSGSKENVKMTVVGGKILYEDGEFPGQDTREIYRKVKETANRIA